MDICIWYTLLSAIAGGVMGARARLGEVSIIFFVIIIYLTFFYLTWNFYKPSLSVYSTPSWVLQIRPIEMVHKRFQSFPEAFVKNLVSSNTKRLAYGWCNIIFHILFQMGVHINVSGPFMFLFLYFIFFVLLNSPLRVVEGGWEDPVAQSVWVEKPQQHLTSGVITLV